MYIDNVIILSVKQVEQTQPHTRSVISVTVNNGNFICVCGLLVWLTIAMCILHHRMLSYIFNKIF